MEEISKITLSGLLRFPKVREKFLDKIDKTDFADKLSQDVFLAIVQMVGSSSPITREAVTGWFRGDSTMSIAVSLLYDNQIPELTDDVFTRFKEAGVRTRLRLMSEYVARSVAQPATPTVNILTEVKAMTDRLEGTTILGFDEPEQVVEATIQKVRRWAEGGYGVHTGIPEVDSNLFLRQLEGFVVIAAPPSVGKALALDTPIPTPSGWTTMGELKTGDYVLSDNGRPCKVTFATDVMYDRECYEVKFSTGECIVADAEHQWVTTTRTEYERQRTQRRYSKVKPVRELLDLGRYDTSIVTTQQIKDTLTVNSGKRLNHFVYCCSALELPKKDLLLNPYALGVWLGDGNSSDARFTCEDDGILYHLSKEGIVPVNTNYRSNEGKARLFKMGDSSKKSRSVFKQGLKALGLLKNKHIPVEYLRSSYEDRLSLLQGLMDTDGYCNTNGWAEFCNTNKRLAQDVFELVCSLGIKATIHEGAATLNGRYVSQKWRVVFSTQLPVFRLTRKRSRLKTKATRADSYRTVVAVEKCDSVPVKCIQVDSPNSMYLVGKHFIPTHNTTLLCQILKANVMKGIPSLFFTLEMSKEDIYIKLAQGEPEMRGRYITEDNLADAEFVETLEKCIRRYERLPLYIFDNVREINHMYNVARRMGVTRGVRLTAVDYIQLGQSNNQSDNDIVRVSKVSETLKSLTMPDTQRGFAPQTVIGLSQYNAEGQRQEQQRNSGEQRRRLSGTTMRWSGQVRQDADVLMHLYTEDDTDVPAPEIRLFCDKYRVWRRGWEVPMRFQKDRQTFITNGTSALSVQSREEDLEF